MPQDPIYYAIPVFNILIAIELYLDYRDRSTRHYIKKDSIASMAMGLGSVLIGLGVKVLALAYFYALYQFALFDLAWKPWAWVILLFADDLTFYVHHRLSHEVRILWAAHVNHHSSERFNLSTALRQSWTEILYKYFWWSWLPLLGFHPLMIMTMISFSLIYQFWIHTEFIHKLGPIEWIFNTPSHHRVHHGSDAKYLDRNHAGIFIIWDRLFGTFQQEEEAPKFGLTKNIHTYNPLKIASHEFIDIWRDIRRSPDWKTKLKYLYKSPGWSHDGPDLRAKTLRTQLKEHRA